MWPTEMIERTGTARTKGPRAIAPVPWAMTLSAGRERGATPAATFCCEVRARAALASLILLPVLAHDLEGDDVEQQRRDEQHEAERERGQRLRAVEFVVADQQRHDLHGHGRDGLERVEGELGREPGA